MSTCHMGLYWYIELFIMEHQPYLYVFERQGLANGLMNTIAVRFEVFRALFGQKTPKRTGMTRLGPPGVSSQSVSLTSYQWTRPCYSTVQLRHFRAKRHDNMSLIDVYL